MIFRLATSNDCNRIMQIIRQAQARMKARGTTQWQNGYPAQSNIEHDIANHYGYVLIKEDLPIAYGAIVFDGEPAYDALDGQWLSDRPYVVVHRIAVADEALNQGVATEFMRQTASLARKRDIHSFRIDTNFDNSYMLALVTRMGFTQCGEVNYGNGKRIAFEKLLD